MAMDIDELIEYYSYAQPSLKDTYRESMPPQEKLYGHYTNSSGSGLLIPLSGKACYTLNGTPYELKPGIILHAGAYMNLDKEIISDQTWHYVVVHYNIAEQDTALFPCYDSHFLIETGINAKIANYGEQLNRIEHTYGKLSSLQLRTLFAALLEEIVTSAIRYQQRDDEKIVADAVNFIHENYTKGITIGQLAEFYAIDIKRFSYLFQKNVGVPALAYLTRLRINHAKRLLQTSSYTVAEIAESVGYHDSYYFSRLFKKQTGHSPTGFAMLDAKKSITG
ncbi:AraC-like DNA-binding protein [Desulfitobacterium sp. LBE]|uniref:helix-turn-helix domain-containing protein n=1 Tax=Desulfitobacterium sp. LBE TaxID=884086 RepID=UPI00119BD336|nr:AraC family transcriptional regulator [Desulfitobacterium sp. LBE]TWH57130.1 AraC-like DNA-binding protein [Desulfitobacterium sp. LBE]